MTDRTEAPQTPAGERRQRLFWISLVFTLLGGQIILISTMAYVAASDSSFSIEPDYYQKGLHWDLTAAQLRKNVELGWSLKLEVSELADATGERQLTCRLTDKAKQPLAGATLDMTAFSHARGNERLLLTLAPRGAGEYETKLRFSRPGTWEFRFVVQRGPETFTQTVIRQIAPTRS